MKIRCYNKYTKQRLVISTGDDDGVGLSAHASRYASGSIYITVELDEEYYKAHPDDYAEDPDIKRWSDLTELEFLPDGEGML